MYCSRWIRMLPILIMLGSALTTADQLIARLDPAKESLNEVYKDDVPVSGRVLAGISLVGEKVVDGLAIFPDSNAGGSRVCVQIMSRDGRYWAENEFLIPEAEIDGPVKLYYNSRYNVLERSARDDLAMLSFTGNCDSNTAPEYFLTSRSGFIDQEKVLLMFVNSGRADTYASIQNSSKRSRPEKCRHITEGRRTGYDTICELKLDGLEQSLSLLQIKIYRRKYEKTLAPLELSIRLP